MHSLLWKPCPVPCWSSPLKHLHGTAAAEQQPGALRAAPAAPAAPPAASSCGSRAGQGLCRVTPGAHPLRRASPSQPFPGTWMVPAPFSQPAAGMCPPGKPTGRRWHSCNRGLCVPLPGEETRCQPWGWALWI